MDWPFDLSSNDGSPLHLWNIIGITLLFQYHVCLPTDLCQFTNMQYTTLFWKEVITVIVGTTVRTLKNKSISDPSSIEYSSVIENYMHSTSTFQVYVRWWTWFPEGKSCIQRIARYYQGFVIPVCEHNLSLKSLWNDVRHPELCSSVVILNHVLLLTLVTFQEHRIPAW
jgi:hypothetical protein